MKIIAAIFYLIIACQYLAADALSYKEPRKDQSDILLSALTKLQALEVPRLYSRLSDPETAYYLRDASLLGRTDTAQGFKNVIRVTFVRSSPYSDDRAVTPPPRAHSFIVVFGDSLDPESYLEIPMHNSAFLQDTVISVDQVLYDLTDESTFRVFKKIKSEQGVAPQSATRSESKSEGGGKPQPESEAHSR